MARIAGVDLPRDKRTEIALDVYLRHWPHIQSGNPEDDRGQS